MQHHQLRLGGARVKVQPLMLSLVIRIYWGQHTIVCSGRALLSSVVHAGDDEEGGGRKESRQARREAHRVTDRCPPPPR